MKTGCVFSEKLSRGKMHGEDAYPYVKDNIVAVADGLGGRGPEQYRDIVTGKIYTSAYIGANTVLESIQSIPAEELNAETLRTAIQNGLNTAKSKYEKVHTGISSSMFKTFPTTLALGYIDNMDLLHAYWCGDSRVYVWESERGLLQISKDDLEDEALNPFTNIAEGGRMSQFISLSTNYSINEASYQIGKEKNALIFAASDGVFDFFQSPMHFEMFLLELLQKNESFDAFITELQSSLVRISGDDVSMGMLFKGSSTYNCWKFDFKKRMDVLKNEMDEIEKNKELLIENDRKISVINQKISELSKEILSRESAEIVNKLVDAEFPEEIVKEFIRLIPKELAQEMSEYQEEVKKNVAMLKEMEKILLMKLAKEYLQREQTHLWIWTNEYKYKELINERELIKNTFEELAKRIKKLGNVMMENTNAVAEKLIHENVVDEEYFPEAKKIMGEILSIMQQVENQGKLVKRKERCEYSIDKICEITAEKYQKLYKEFIWEDKELSFSVNSEIRDLLEAFRHSKTEKITLMGKREELKKRIQDHLLNSNIYEIAEKFCREEEMLKFAEFKKCECEYLQQQSIYEKEIQTKLENMWNVYRKSYESYLVA